MKNEIIDLPVLFLVDGYCSLDHDKIELNRWYSYSYLKRKGNQVTNDSLVYFSETSDVEVINNIDEEKVIFKTE